MRTGLTAFVLLLAACSSPPRPAWPVPEGWRSETIPFPLEFAPSLPYRGVEELRFAPGFFKPAEPLYFTYSFVWVVDGTPSFVDLSGDLRTYFGGLARAVSPKTFDATRHQAAVTREANTIRGTVTTVDAFGDGHTLDLRVAGEIVPCTGGRTGLVLSLSPRTDAETWTMLADQRRSMRC